ncbi:TetR/AcrR family transcriptional regulator [Desulforhopalus singaporensis]|uniref:Biofilm operon icaADBC HTH-type negative transcriptional regulator IcaR n=1 Tax=Desulforhopalus singaporensis TaxID=91360 RepID=A0A1H0LW20_9BACT|nr:TetR/AcrR family transcriptional regulator [Desulforhopalus singaporensis]SDO72293.1 transcriptional regulator, TetR family [Desulforhopalus singaporensis]
MAGRKNRNAELRIPEILEAYYRVLIDEGLEGTSISKIAKSIDIHPSLILHYFQNKDNLRAALIELIVSKFKSRHLINFDHIEDDQERFDALMDMIFSYEWSRTVDPGVHFGFYYQSFRDEHVHKLFTDMFVWFRDFLHDQFVDFNRKGVIQVSDEVKAADFVLTMMEGLEFHAHFLAGDNPFEDFAQSCKKTAYTILKNRGV